MNVNIDTKFITLIGDPLRQSFAARMQNAGYEAAGLNMLYFYTEADNEHLGDIVKGLRYMNFAGFAVTKPNKIKVLEYLDELDPLCEKMGSSNTVVKTAEGKLVYSADSDNTLFLWEQWESRAHQKIHCQTEHFAVLSELKAKYGAVTEILTEDRA